MPYQSKNIPLARKLRKEMTPWERKLWYCFLTKYPIRFQRQKAIGNYIIDFYCASAKLAIELDGSGHYTPESMKKDDERTTMLQSHGIEVIRVRVNLKAVFFGCKVGGAGIQCIALSLRPEHSCMGQGELQLIGHDGLLHILLQQLDLRRDLSRCISPTNLYL